MWRSAYVEDYAVMKISGCVALVTGGASGIGRGLCDVLLQRNAKVSLFISLDKPRANEAGLRTNFWRKLPEVSASKRG